MTLSRCLVLLGLCALVGAAGCGRKADLDAPDQAVRDAARPAGIGINRPVEAAPQPVEERRFILDPLI